MDDGHPCHYDFYGAAIMAVTVMAEMTVKMVRPYQLQDEQHNTTQERGTPQYKVKVNLFLHKSTKE